MLFVRPRIRSLPWVTSTTCCIGKRPIQEWGNSSRCSRAGYRRMRAGWTLERLDFNSLPKFDRPFQEIDGMCSGLPNRDCCFTNNQPVRFFHFSRERSIQSNAKKKQRKNKIWCLTHKKTFHVREPTWSLPGQQEISLIQQEMVSELSYKERNLSRMEKIEPSLRSLKTDEPVDYCKGFHWKTFGKVSPKDRG